MKGHLSEKICDISPGYRKRLEETITGYLHGTLQQQKRWTVHNASPSITGTMQNPTSGRPGLWSGSVWTRLNPICCHSFRTYRSGSEMTMKMIKVADVVSGPNPHHVDARKVYESPHAMAVVITLQPGESLKKHITPVDVFFYTLEGTGIVEIGNERESCTKDMLIESPAKVPHRWMNESDAVFRVLVVKVPKPAEETKIL